MEKELYPKGVLVNIIGSTLNHTYRIVSRTGSMVKIETLDGSRTMNYPASAIRFARLEDVDPRELVRWRILQKKKKSSQLAR